jgi:DNA-binding NtrC family response regulator
MPRPFALVSRDEQLLDEFRSEVATPSDSAVTHFTSAEPAARQALNSADPVTFLDVRSSADLQLADDVLQHLMTQPESVVTLIPICDGGYPRELAATLGLLAAATIQTPFDESEIAVALQFLSDRHQARSGRKIPPSCSIEAGDLNLTTFTRDLFPVLDQLVRVASRNVTLLLVGETGSGKTTLGHLIHLLSQRSDKPFHNVACGALPRDLIESELFGHVRGAFTGADRSKVGRFEAANNGTLLLDEIDILGPKEQGKLLKVIESGEFELVGSNETRTSSARLIVASNVDLDKLAAEDRFRTDLYYRLNVLEFRLPLLRDRPLDIVQLAMQFVDECCTEHSIEIETVDLDYLEAIRRYTWPGNLRELKNHMQRAVLLSSDARLTVNDLSHVVISAQFEEAAKQEQKATTEWSLSDRIARSERQMLDEALSAHNQKRTVTAKALGLSRVGLYKKMKKYGMLDSQKETAGVEQFS